MGVTFSSNFDKLPEMMRNAAERKMAEQMVAKMRESGVTSVDRVDISIEGDGGKLQIRPERVRELAAEILASSNGELNAAE